MHDAEFDDLFQTVYEQYGWDFRCYARASLRRRVELHVRREKLSGTEALHAAVQADPSAMERLFTAITVHVSAMFRDPEFYRAFRERVVPVLGTYPYLRFWVAGSSTGEEIYSLAILLHEAGLYSRSRIYATDINDIVLENAKSGIFPIGQMRDYARNYQAAGGQASFAEYYTADAHFAVLRPFLRNNVVFAAHNLASDASFNEFHVIFCRNVMIYFDRQLQNRVHSLFYNSLLTFGYLGLGRSETIRYSPHESAFEVIEGGQRLYRRLK
jgi:chemotaxis protein methyltransferase CheR